MSAERTVPRDTLVTRAELGAAVNLSELLEAAMDFSRNSFPTWDVADGLFADRNFGSIDASTSFRPVPFLGLNAMIIRTDISHDPTNDTLQDDAQLHAALRDVPLPVGFMRRMRQLVGQGLESSE